MRIWIVCIALVLAGCTDPEDTDVDAPEDEETVIEAPTWAVGDWWTYDLGGSSITWVVTEDGGSDWIVDVDDADLAFSHAKDAQVSTIGPIGKSDLEGSQEAGRVKFFDFPLTLNKTWDLTWDGVGWQATVVDVFEQTAEVRAEAEDGSTRVYIYDNATAWFTLITAADPNGTELFTAEVEDHGQGYTGNYVRWTLHDAFEVNAVPGAALVESFDVPTEATDLWYEIMVHCDPAGLEGDQGTGVLEVHPQEGDGISRQDVCPTDAKDTGTLEPSPGEWGATVQSTGATIDAIFLPRTFEEYSL